MPTRSSSRNDKLGAEKKSNATFGLEILYPEWDGEICRGNYRGSSIRISTHQVNY
jgi:hypothetical protein